MPRLTTFERYILKTYLYMNAVCLLAFVGLFVVMDLFDNADDFFSNVPELGYVGVLKKMLIYYAYQALVVFDLTAVPLISISIIIVLITLQRRQQLKPLMAAGIPTYRFLAPPLVIGALFIIGLKNVNRDLILENYAHQMHETRGADKATKHDIDPAYDHKSLIYIDGTALFPKENRIEMATFILPQPGVVDEITTITAEQAIYRRSNGQQPAGWYLSNTSHDAEQLSLTSFGESLIHETTIKGGLFIQSSIGPDLLYKGKNGTAYLSSSSLIRRIRNSVLDTMTLRQLQFEFHSRLMEPFLCASAVFLTLPLVLKRDSRGLIMNTFYASMMLGGVYLIAMGSRFLATSGVVHMHAAVWIPVFVSLSVAAWSSPRIET